MYTILLVDDRDDTCEAYATLLRHAGFGVLCAKNGQEACMLAHDLHPDLIVTDLNMPILTGWEAARILKQDARTADIPIIALSAYAYPDEVYPDHAECQFDAVWVKPFPPTRLLEETERRFRRVQAA